jgi:hypothetical protein
MTNDGKKNRTWSDTVSSVHGYDTVDREQLYLVMGKLEIPSKLIRMVKLTMEDTKSHVRIQSDLSAVAMVLVRDVNIRTNGTTFYKSSYLHLWMLETS